MMSNAEVGIYRFQLSFEETALEGDSNDNRELKEDKGLIKYFKLTQLGQKNLFSQLNLICLINLIQRF